MDSSQLTAQQAADLYLHVRDGLSYLSPPVAVSYSYQCPCGATFAVSMRFTLPRGRLPYEAGGVHPLTATMLAWRASRNMDDELRRLVERYRPLAATTTATEFCRQVLGDGIGVIQAAMLLRDLYGMNLMECKTALEIARDHQRNC